jgi:hypothetical protein
MTQAWKKIGDVMSSKFEIILLVPTYEIQTITYFITVCGSFTWFVRSVARIKDHCDLL